MANDYRPEGNGEHTILVGVTVLAPTREVAEDILFTHITRDDALESWWIAEDVLDASDADAVFQIAAFGEVVYC